MPLIVHPSSTCDVCLELYSWNAQSDNNGRPYAISCGHVFCFGCLQRMQPSTCPLCRKAFLPDRIKKLHIDRPPNYADDDDSTRVSELLQRVALVSGENAAEEQVMSVIGDVQQWLATRDDRTHVVYKPLRLAVAALHRYCVTRKEAVSARESIQKQNQEYLKHLHRKDEDLRVSRTIEENLVERMERLEDEYKTKLTRAEKTMQETDVELARLRAEHAHFRTELARYQEQASRHARSPNPVINPNNRASLEIEHPWQQLFPPEKNSYYPGRTVRPPVMPLDPIQSTSREYEHERTVSPPQLQRLGPPPAARRIQRKTVGTPWIIPGAPPSERVVPPVAARFAASPIGTLVVNSVSMAEAVTNGPDRYPTTEFMERSERTPRGETPQVQGSTGPSHQTRQSVQTIAAPNYGFIVGGGYVPLREPSTAAASQINEESGVVSGLMLFSDAAQSSFGGASASGHSRTVEAAARALAVSSGEVETAEATWGHVRTALRHSIPWNESTSSIATTVATSVRTRHDSAGTSDADTDTDAASDATSASARLSNLHLFPSDSRGPHERARAMSTATRRAPRDASRSIRSRPSSPEPSLASTWGTVPSARSSRSSGLGALNLAGLPSASTLNLTSGSTSLASSHNPSLADLGLRNLPSTVTLSMRSYESLAIGAAAGPAGTGPSPDQVLVTGDAHARTPRAAPWGASLDDADGGSPVSELGLGLAAPQPSVPLAGLGLTFPNNLSSSSSSLINGPQDLDQVSESLQQLFNEERSTAPSTRRRRERFASMSTVEDMLSVPAQQRNAGGPSGDSHDRQLGDGPRISDDLSPEPQVPTSIQMSSGLLFQPYSQVQQSRAPASAAAAGQSDHHLDHQRRRSSVTATAASSQSQLQPQPQPQPQAHPRSVASSGRGQPRWDALAQTHDSDRVAQAASPPAQPRALGNAGGPTSPLGIAATQSRDSLMGGGSSLLLSFAPPSTSTAATASGEPTTAIHAPRPVDRRQGTTMFGFLRGRGRRAS